MDFEAILRYRDIDVELNEAVAELKKNEAYASFNRANEQNKNALASIVANEGKLKELNAEILQIKKEIENLEIVLKETDEDLSNALANYQSIEEMNKNQHESNALEALDRQMADLGIRVKKCIDGINQIDADIQKARENSANAQAKMKKYHDEVEVVFNKTKAKTDDLKKEKAALESKIDPKMLSIYKRLLASKELQGKKLVVELKEEDIARQFCTGCFKNIGNAIDKIREPGTYMECPECGRILLRK